MNRIYQGRVSRVEILLPGKKGNKPEHWTELADWESALWKHHELFQDAVNYYLFRLAVLARDDGSPLGQLRAQLAGVWESFSRQGRKFKGLRDSLRPHLAPQAATFSFEEAVRLAEADAGDHLEAAVVAVESLVADLGGDSAIQQGGRGYFPLFCSPTTKARFPRSAEALRKKTGKSALPALLHSDEAAANLHWVSGQLNFGFFANPVAGAVPFVADAHPRLALPRPHRHRPAHEDDHPLRHV